MQKEAKTTQLSGMIYADSDVGIAQGIGTKQDPTATIPQAKVIADLKKIRNIHVNGSAHTIEETMQGYNFYGDSNYGNQVIDLNSKNVDSSTFHNLKVIGTQAGTVSEIKRIFLFNCLLDNVIDFNGVAKSCFLRDIAVPLVNGWVSFINCTSLDNGTNSEIELNVPGNCSILGFIGDLQLTNLTNGAIYVHLMAGSTLTIDGDCTGGNIFLYGEGSVTDNSGAGCTVSILTINEQGAISYNDIYDNNVKFLLETALDGSEVSGSIARMIYIIEHHLHNVDHIFPQVIDADGNEAADYDSLVTVTSHADKNRFGPWVTLIPQADLAAFDKFDPGTLFISNADANKFFNIQIGYGDCTPAGTTVIGNTQLNSNEKVGRESPVNIRAKDVDEDGVSDVCVRTTSSANASEDSFECNLELHPYPPVAIVHET